MTWQHYLSLFGQSLGIVLFGLSQFAALLMIPLGLPGIWFQVLAASLLTAYTGHLGWWWVLAIAALAALGEALDWMLGELGLSSVGASKLAAWFALLCGFVFGFFGFLITLPVPLLGAMVMSFIGTFVGATLGEMIHEQKLHPKLKVAMAAVLGRACGIAAKMSLCFIATGVAFIALVAELAVAIVQSK